jgi:hypothetical protein
MVDLFQLTAKFQALNNRETDVASFHTHVPWVAPEAYLNIIYRPARPEVLAEVSARIKMPPPLRDLLARYNGAILLSGSLSLFGAVPQGQLLGRSEPSLLPPYNIESENRSWPPPDRNRFLKVGGYGFDGSGVCIDREDLKVVVFRRKEREPHCSWQTIDEWLDSEIRRLSVLFDVSGRPLVDESKTLPSADAQA